MDVLQTAWTRKSEAWPGIQITVSHQLRQAKPSEWSPDRRNGMKDMQTKMASMFSYRHQVGIPITWLLQHPAPCIRQKKTEVNLELHCWPCLPAVNWLKIFNTVSAGSLTILLTSCTNLTAPQTLFVTFGAAEENFKDESEQIRRSINKYTEAFQHLNPDINVVWINYKAADFSIRLQTTAP